MCVSDTKRHLTVFGGGVGATGRTPDRLVDRPDQNLAFPSEGEKRGRRDFTPPTLLCAIKILTFMYASTSSMNCTGGNFTESDGDFSTCILAMLLFVFTLKKDLWLIFLKSKYGHEIEVEFKSCDTDLLFLVLVLTVARRSPQYEHLLRRMP